MYVSLYFIMNDGIRLYIVNVANFVSSADVAISISHSVSVEILSCCSVLILLSACFDALRKSSTFADLNSCLQTKVSVAWLRFLAYHCTENIGRLTIKRNLLVSLINGYWMFDFLHRSFLHVVLHLPHLKNINTRTYGDKHNARCKYKKSIWFLPTLEFSFIRRIFSFL